MPRSAVDSMTSSMRSWRMDSCAAMRSMVAGSSSRRRALKPIARSSRSSPRLRARLGPRPPHAEPEPFVRIPGVDEVLVCLARLQAARQHGDEHLGSVPDSARREEVLMGVDDRATTEEIVDGIRAALTTRDPRVLESHLADDARWESCVGREQVIEYMESAARLDVALES